MRFFNIIFTILFVIAAALQYNDPDPWLWMPIYLYGAIFCFLAFKQKYYPRAYLIGILVYLAYGIVLFFGKNGVLTWAREHHAENIAASMQASAPWIEQSREFFGLLILIIVLMINYFSSLNIKR